MEPVNSMGRKRRVSGAHGPCCNSTPAGRHAGLWRQHCFGTGDNNWQHNSQRHNDHLCHNVCRVTMAQCPPVSQCLPCHNDTMSTCVTMSAVSQWHNVHLRYNGTMSTCVTMSQWPPESQCHSVHMSHSTRWLHTSQRTVFGWSRYKPH